MEQEEGEGKGNPSMALSKASLAGLSADHPRPVSSS